MTTDDEDSESSPHLAAESWHDDSRPGSPGSTKSMMAAAAPSASSAPPAQKRRRVTRACDECRLKKIKCDGKSPCTHCAVYSYDCTYDKPSSRRRNPAPQYIEALENRLHLAETLVRKFLPDIDLADPTLDSAVQHEFQKRAQARAKAAAAVGIDAAAADAAAADAAAAQAVAAASTSRTAGGDAKADGEELALMLESISQLELDDGGWDFHGTSSGAVFLSRMMAHFGKRLGQSPFPPRPQTRPPVPGPTEPSPGGPAASPFDLPAASVAELPSREDVLSLCGYALTHGASLFRVLHQPSFYETLDRLLDKSVDCYTEDDMRFLGLLFAVMALGSIYRNLDNPDPSVTGRSAKEEGTKWYNLSAAILPNINDSRDITSLQTIVFRILFLQSMRGLSTCYTLIGVAIRCALRMGLHRHLQHERISPIEQEVRRRVFWTIRQMDIYVSVLLGFPVPLNDDEIDQPFPTEVDDEYISQDGIRQPLPGTPSFIQPVNAMLRLMGILSKITKYVYPMRGVKSGFDRAGTETYRVGYAQLKEIEADLAKWQEDLPAAWRPSPDGAAEVVRVRHQLRFTYAHVQLVLYRPFLQYVSPRLGQEKKIDALAYACAVAAINVSRNIVHIGSEIRRQGALSGTFWVVLYTEFFAALSLVFYVLENPGKAGSAEVLADAQCARQNLAKLARKSLAAESITGTLNKLFDQLPADFDVGKISPAAVSRKRAAPASQPQPQKIPVPPTFVSGGVPRGQSILLSQAMSMTPPRPLQQQTSPAESSFCMGGMSKSSFSDRASARVTPESGNGNGNGTGTGTGTGTPASTKAPLGIDGAAYHQSPPSHGVDHSHENNTIQRLNLLMFPSEDPFAYPNQAMMMELGFQNAQPEKGPTTGSIALGQQYTVRQQQHGALGSQLLMSHGFSTPQQQQQQQLHHQQGFDPVALLGIEAGGSAVGLYQDKGPCQMAMQVPAAMPDPMVSNMGQPEWAAMWDYQGL